MQKPSIVFWIVAVLALLWNGFGLFDYVMTLSNNEEYLAQYTEEQMAYWQGMPFWRLGLWTLGIAAGFVGAVLFIMRRKLATTLWLIAIASILLNSVADLFMGGIEVLGLGMIAFGAAFVGGVQFLFWLYAKRQEKKGVLA